MNTIYTIVVYRSQGYWVFDDAKRGIVQEAFVSGTDRLIDMLTVNIRHAKYGFVLRFSADPWPGQQVHLRRLTDAHLNEEAKKLGTWYWCHEFQSPGWLCSALFKYFNEAPKHIYVAAHSINRPFLKRLLLNAKEVLGA